MKWKLQEFSTDEKFSKRRLLLRKKKEDLESERDAALHIIDGYKMQTERIKEQNEVLENF